MVRWYWLVGLLGFGSAWADTAPDYRAEVQGRLGQLQNYVMQYTAASLRSVSVAPAPNNDGDDFEIRVILSSGNRVILPLRDLAAIDIDRQINLAGAILVRRIQDDRRANHYRIRQVRQTVGGTENLSLATGRMAIGASLRVGNRQAALSIYQMYGGYEVDRDPNERPLGSARRQVRRRVARLDFTYEAGQGSDGGDDIRGGAFRATISAFELAAEYDGESSRRDDSRLWIRPGVLRYSLANYDNDSIGITNRVLSRIDVDAAEVGGTRETHFGPNFQLYVATSLALGARLLNDDERGLDLHLNHQLETGFVAWDRMVFRAYQQIDFARDGNLFLLSGVELGVRSSNPIAPVYFTVNYAHREDGDGNSRSENPYFQTPDGHSVSLIVRREFQ